jgi:hypothetical protein
MKYVAIRVEGLAPGATERTAFLVVNLDPKTDPATLADNYARQGWQLTGYARVCFYDTLVRHKGAPNAERYAAERP